jgi:pantothenate kinase
VAVSPQTRLVITEGNYLLVEAAPWAELPALCDEIWYVETPEPARLRRLARRHQRYGRTAAQAWERAVGSDGQNAAVVAATRDRADLVVALPDDG